jgi:hypothetical protein
MTRFLKNRPIAGNRPNCGCDLRRLSYGAGVLDFFILYFDRHEQAGDIQNAVAPGPFCG